jgi:uncharacterized membrane protein YphA (DoxX/SURF4 family)
LRVSFHTPHAREAVTAGVGVLSPTAPGGILLIVGLTPWPAFALAIDMLVAGLTAHAGNGFFADKGGCELMLGSASVTVLIAGAGASMPQNGCPVVRHKLYPARTLRPH